MSFRKVPGSNTLQHLFVWTNGRLMWWDLTFYMSHIC